MGNRRSYRAGNTEGNGSKPEAPDRNPPTDFPEEAIYLRARCDTYESMQPRRLLNALRIPVLALTLVYCSANEPGRPDVSNTSDTPRVGDVTPGDFSGRYTDSHGRLGRYVGWVPEGVVRPGVLAFLHADDGGDNYAEWIDDATRALAKAHNMIAISVQEPDGSCWWAPRQEDNAHFFGDLVADLLIAARRVDPARVYLVGKSGGSFFASGVPALLGFPWGGAVVGLCGGDIPRRNGGNCSADTDPPVADVPLFSATAPTVRYWFATTTGDEYRRYSMDAANTFRTAGAEVTFRDVGSGGHCSFNLMAELTTALDALDP
jgi:hypothetical protein